MREKETYRLDFRIFSLIFIFIVTSTFFRAGSLNRESLEDHRHRSFSATGDSRHRQGHRNLKIQLSRATINFCHNDDMLAESLQFMSIRIYNICPLLAYNLHLPVNLYVGSILPHFYPLYSFLILYLYYCLFAVL